MHKEKYAYIVLCVGSHSDSCFLPLSSLLLYPFLYPFLLQHNNGNRNDFYV